MLNLIFLVCMCQVDSIVLMDLPIIQLGVELSGCGVKRVYTGVLLVTVIIIENGSLADGHANDGASVLVRTSRAPVTVTALGSEQNRGDVVDFVGGLCACTLLGDTPALAPSVTGIQDESEEENQEEESNEASLHK